MKIFHLSDLHFGTEIPGGAEALLKNANAEKPDLIIVSGDFTQIASASEFQAAAAFLKLLNAPLFTVPGNHDVPRYDFIARMTSPFERYKKFINPDLSPVYMGSDICIAGINTARRILPHWNWANGAISGSQLDWLKDIYTASNAAIRICVMHHPIHKAEGNPLKTVVFGAGPAFNSLIESKVNLVLTGHVHHASITTMEKDNHKIVFLSASTSLSRRLRGQTNGYNVITLRDGGFSVDVYAYKDGAFIQDQRYMSA